MKRFVYILQHSYEYGENLGHTKSELLGVFSTKLQVQRALEKCFTLPEFKDYPIECFSINKYKVDKGEWIKGFVEIE
ncbi:MAG: hypothetical protein Q4D26_12885 [Clostridia bacterium]|nr:hypothetical protein [Clostridia bacterium]